MQGIWTVHKVTVTQGHYNLLQSASGHGKMICALVIVVIGHDTER